MSRFDPVGAWRRFNLVVANDRGNGTKSERSNSGSFDRTSLPEIFGNRIGIYNPAGVLGWDLPNLSLEILVRCGSVKTEGENPVVCCLPSLFFSHRPQERTVRVSVRATDFLLTSVHLT